MQSSETDADFQTPTIPKWARAAGLLRCFLYRGNSMLPTFHAGHLLYVRPSVCDIVPGDVIVFSRSPENAYITHRVIAATASGLVTRGDGSPQNDDGSVLWEQVVGRVEKLEEQGQVKPVRGGRRALLLAQARWGARRIDRWLRFIFGAPYRMLRGPTTARILQRMFAPRFEYISVHTAQGVLVKVLHHGRVVARWQPNAGHFECRKPYDLVLRRENLWTDIGIPSPQTTSE